MPAAVETAGFANTPAWHREGIVIDTGGKEGLTVEQAIPATGLDWTVRKVPIFAYSEYATAEDGKLTSEPTPFATVVQIPDRFGVQRSSDKKILGTVGKAYRPYQNTQGFAILDEMIKLAGGQDRKLWIEAGGALDGGKKVWLLAHLESDLLIAGEPIAEYLLFTNGHDGRTSITMATTSVRVVCANTLALALGTTPRVINVRHTTKADQRIKEASHLLGLRDAYAEELAKQGEWLVEQEMPDSQFELFLQSLMPTDQEAGTPGHTMVAERRGKIASLYANAENLKPIKGTRWGALNAVVEYADHRRGFRDDNSALKNQFGLVGSGTALKDRALAVLRTKDLEPPA